MKPARRYRPSLLLAALLLLGPAAAGAMEEPVTPEAFREFSEGYTLYFTEKNGTEVGAEAFGADGRATWQSPDGTCIEGLWQAYDGQLCFYYGFEDVVQCWNVLRDEQGLLVRRAGEDQDPPDLTYRITGRDRRPLICGGPSSDT